MIFKIIYGSMLGYLTISILWHRLILLRIPGQVGAVFVYALILLNVLVLGFGFREVMRSARATKMGKN
jgi:hypothetical protein